LLKYKKTNGDKMTWIISRAMMKAYENSPCSQGLVEEYLEENYSDGERFAPLNVIVTPHPFWLRDKTTDILSHSRFSQMCLNLPEEIGEDVLMSFRRDFLARTSPLPESKQESTEKQADSGEKWSELSARYDRDTSGWKTHRCLWEEDLHWSQVSLPKWGRIDADGELWERTTQEPDTNGIGAGCGESWPTPTANEDAAGTPDGKMQWMLTQAAKSGCATRKEYQSWPTPNTSDYKGSGTEGPLRDRLDYATERGATKSNTYPKNWATPQARDHRTGGADRWENPERSRNLNDQVAHQHSFPSPGTTGMSNGSGNCEKSNKLHEAGVITDDERKSMRAGNGGQLNPDWVCWLMGWPISWTQLDPLEHLDWRGWDVDPADLPPDHPDYVPRIATDIPNRIDRLRAIGNGQVPQAMVLAWHELTTNKEK
jgi:hypothetical protein